MNTIRAIRAADQNGNVKLTNVNIINEMSDMREANRSYEANLQILKKARDLLDNNQPLEHFSMIEALSSLTTTARGVAGDLSSALSSAAAPISGGSQDFGQVLGQMSGDAVNTIKTGEATAISGLQGNAPVQDVVQAVMSAEQTVQTVIAIRDKVVAAYQEITRLTI